MNEMDDLPEVARVMRGLRRAEASPGMEARVLERLAAANALGGTGEAGRRWLPVALRWACAMAVVCGGASAVRREHVLHERPAMAPVSSGERVGLPGMRAATGEAGSGDLNVVHALRGRRMPSNNRAERPVTPASTVAVESYPAPPMPLTRQERLLLRMLRGGDTGELVATLAPGAEMAVRSEEKEQFRKFFRPASVVADPAHPAEKPLPDTGLDDGAAGPPKVLQVGQGETQ